MNHANKKCFVLMPFTDALKEIYTEVYKPCCDSNGLYCWRVDEISRPGSISKDIIEGILDADVIIADLTNKNANVFYELGIAHASGNKTIMTSQSKVDVPFDIASYRILFYSHTLKGCEALRTALDSAIKELLVALDRTNNPFQEVISYRGVTRVSKRIPLAKHIDFSSLPDRICRFFEDRKIIYTDDITPQLLDELASTPGIGRTYLSRLCSPLIQHDIFADAEFIQQFVIKHKLDGTGKRHYF